MKNNHGLMTLAMTILLVLRSLPLAAADADNYWSGWRARQRAELVTLAKPPGPPTGTGSLVDRFLIPNWEKVTPPGHVSDAVFARRVYLDVIGLLPTTEQLNQFLGDSGMDKRTRLVDSLLADKQGYAEH